MNTDQSFTKYDNYQDGKSYDRREIDGNVPRNCQRRREGRVHRFHVLRTSTEVITICLGRLRKVISFTMHTAAACTSLKKENPDRKTSTASGLQNAGRKQVVVNIEYQETIDKFGCRLFTLDSPLSDNNFIRYTL